MMYFIAWCVFLVVVVVAVPVASMMENRGRRAAVAPSEEMMDEEPVEGEAEDAAEEAPEFEATEEEVTEFDENAQ